MFGLAHPIPRGLAVRRRIPPVAHRHLRRLPDDVQAAHDDWQRTTISLDDLTRAHRLGMAMVDIGDDVTVVEHQLVALGVGGVVAAEVARQSQPARGADEPVAWGDASSPIDSDGCGRPTALCCGGRSWRTWVTSPDWLACI